MKEQIKELKKELEEVKEKKTELYYEYKDCVIELDKLKEPRTNVGVAVLVKKDGKYLLGKRSKVNMHGVGTWCSPGGHIEFNESPEDTAKRETFEETGIKIKNVTFIGITNDLFKKEMKHYITIWFSADYASGKVNHNPEYDEIGWFSQGKLPKPLFVCMKNLAHMKQAI